MTAGGVTDAEFKQKGAHTSKDDVEQLKSEIKSMKRKFASLLTMTRESIRVRKVPLDCLIALLSSYRTFPAVIKREEK